MSSRIRSHIFLSLLIVLISGLMAPVALGQYVDHPRIHLTPERIERIRTHHWQADSYEWQKLMSCAARHDMDGVKAQALAYVITDDESWAIMAVENIEAVMLEIPELRVSFNNVGRNFNAWALAYDWLYHSPNFSADLKQRIIDYVSAVPMEGSGKWNYYPDITYMNGVAKIIWGPPLWGIATHGDNPMADIYIDNGMENRWEYIRNGLGYGPDNLAVARGGSQPQGQDYSSGTLAHICRYVSAVRSSTGVNLFEEAPNLKQYLEFFVNSYYYTEDFIRRPEHGHNAHKGGGYLHNAIVTALILSEEYRDTPEARRAVWWLNNIEGAAEYPGNNYRYFGIMDVLFSDPTIPELDPSSEPLAYFTEGNGSWICRSNWTSGATELQTFATFRAGNWTWFNQNHWDEGNYCIYSHGADLLIDAGIYEGSGGNPVLNYHAQTIAHNSITVKDPQQTKGWNHFDPTVDTYQNSGGQNVPYRSTYSDVIVDGEPLDPDWPNTQGDYVHDMSEINRRTHNERFTYAFADMTNSYANTRWEIDYPTQRLTQVDYRPKVTNVSRHWIYLRETPGNDDEYFVTFDRVSSTDADFEKKTHLHFIGEPMMSNGSAVDIEVSGHIETWDSDRFTMETDGAMLHAAVLLPTDAVIRKVGGTGYEYWVNGENYDPFPTTENELGGVWRAEIIPGAPRLDDNFFTVLHPDWAGSPAPEVARIPSTDFEGASFDGWVVMFSKSEEEQVELGYSVDMGGQQRHLIFDMQSGFNYNIYRNGDGSPIAMVTAGNDGIVEFESPGGGSFQISQGDLVPDFTPPTGSLVIGTTECTGDRQVRLTLSAVDTESGMGGGKMRFSNNGTTWSEDIPYQQTYLWDLSAGDGSKTVYALFADVMGNWMTDPVSDGISLDDTPPTADFNIVESEVDSSIVTLSSSGNDIGCGGDVVRVSFSNDGVSWSSYEDLSTGRIWDFGPSGEGTYTVYASFVDPQGNRSDPPLSDTVELVLEGEDTTPPELYALQPEDGATDVSITTSVGFLVRDLASAVDTTTITMTINGQELDYETVPFTSNRFMIIAQPSSELSVETEYSVAATVADIIGNQTTVNWSFTTSATGEDTQPPLPPTGLEVTVDENCDITVTWDQSFDPTIVAWQVSYGTWPQGTGEAVELEFQDQIGQVIADQPNGEYWVGLVAMNAQGQISSLYSTPEAVVLGCSDDPDPPDIDPVDDGLGPAEDAESGSIWPPGVIKGHPLAALQVSNLKVDWTVRLYTVSGKQVLSFRAETDDEDFRWDLLNSSGREVAKGLYMVRVYDDKDELVEDGYYLKR